MYSQKTTCRLHDSVNVTGCCSVISDTNAVGKFLFAENYTNWDGWASSTIGFLALGECSLYLVSEAGGIDPASK